MYIYFHLAIKVLTTTAKITEILLLSNDKHKFVFKTELVIRSNFYAGLSEILFSNLNLFENIGTL